jgi:hypothetical protein
MRIHGITPALYSHLLRRGVSIDGGVVSRDIGVRLVAVTNSAAEGVTYEDLYNTFDPRLTDLDTKTLTYRQHDPGAFIMTTLDLVGKRFVISEEVRRQALALGAQLQAGGKK